MDSNFPGVSLCCRAPCGGPVSSHIGFWSSYCINRRIVPPLANARFMYLNYVNRRCWKIYWSEGANARRERVEAASHHSLRPPSTQREATNNPGHNSRTTRKTAKPHQVTPFLLCLRNSERGHLGLINKSVMWLYSRLPYKLWKGTLAW